MATAGKVHANVKIPEGSTAGEVANILPAGETGSRCWTTGAEGTLGTIHTGVKSATATGKGFTGVKSAASGRTEVHGTMRFTAGKPFGHTRRGRHHELETERNPYFKPGGGTVRPPEVKPK